MTPLRAKAITFKIVRRTPRSCFDVFQDVANDIQRIHQQNTEAVLLRVLTDVMRKHPDARITRVHDEVVIEYSVQPPLACERINIDFTVMGSGVPRVTTSGILLEEPRFTGVMAHA